jgi:hypothetical protein
MAPHWKCGSGQPVAGSNPALSATPDRAGRWDDRGMSDDTGTDDSSKDRRPVPPVVASLAVDPATAAGLAHVLTAPRPTGQSRPWLAPLVVLLIVGAVALATLLLWAQAGGFGRPHPRDAGSIHLRWHARREGRSTARLQPADDESLARLRAIEPVPVLFAHDRQPWGRNRA